MDLDVFVSAHRAEWRRLEELTQRRRQLDGAEVDELVDLYQRVATHLSTLRSANPDPDLLSWLSGVVARARSAVVGAHTAAWHDVARFFVRTFPAVVYRTRWWWIATAAGCVLLAAALGYWVASDPQVQATLLPPEDVQQLVGHEFENYYVEYPAASFAAQVWANNVRTTAIALILGVFLGLPTLYILFINFENLGVIGGYMFAHDRGDIFFGLILPHGLLELTAVFVGAGVGLKLGWTVIDPGDRPRGRALAEEARPAMAVALGLIVVLGVSGLIEGFVTGYVHTTWLRIGIGVLAEAVFLGYVFVLGRRAVLDGETGDIMERPDTAPVAGAG